MGKTSSKAVLKVPNYRRSPRSYVESVLIIGRDFGGREEVSLDSLAWHNVNKLRIIKRRPMILGNELGCGAAKRPHSASNRASSIQHVIVMQAEGSVNGMKARVSSGTSPTLFSFHSIVSQGAAVVAAANSCHGPLAHVRGLSFSPEELCVCIVRRS
jgi:hypothetical protein